MNFYLKASGFGHLLYFRLFIVSLSQYHANEEVALEFAIESFFILN